MKVIDVEDEVPVFHQSSYEARVKENVPDYNVVQVTVSRMSILFTSAFPRLENVRTYDVSTIKSDESIYLYQFLAV